jgi:hypothetical protein
MTLANPDESGFLVFNVTGLEPPKATINQSEVPTMDGSIFNSARLTARNLVLSIMFAEGPNRTIEDVRYLSYKYFPLKEKIRLTVKTDKRHAYCDGYVESNEVVIFQKQEYTQVSVICPDTFFYSLQEVGVVFYGVQPLFHFPFSNESLNVPLLIMGEIINKKEENVYYDGDAPNGFTAYFHFMGPVKDFVLYRVSTQEYMRVYTDVIESITGESIKAADDLVINTVRGRKSVKLIRNAVTWNILSALDVESTWLELRKGDNVFAFTAEEGENNINFRIEALINYEGM